MYVNTIQTGASRSKKIQQLQDKKNKFTHKINKHFNILKNRINNSQNHSPQKKFISKIRKYKNLTMHTRHTLYLFNIRNEKRNQYSHLYGNFTDFSKHEKMEI